LHQQLAFEKLAAMPERMSAKRPRKRPTQERSRATVDAILQATAYILVERGWEALTTNAIARRAGVNIASLYQFFPDKQAIVAELERRHVVETRGKIAEVFLRHKGDGMEARARTLVEAGIAAHRVEPKLHRIFAEQLSRDPRGSRDPFVVAGAIAELSKLGLPHPDLSAWIVAVVSHAVVHDAIVERKADVESGALADELVWLLVRYLKRPRTRLQARGPRVDM